MTATSITELSDTNVPDSELVARATSLVPLVREFAAQGSEARRVAPEVVAALEEAGLFRMLVPKRHGGMGASLRTAVEVTQEIARGDGSTGWVTTLMMVGTGFASTFSEQAQEEVFGSNPLAKVAGTFSPGSKSERVDGGYLVSGRWPYSSGSFAADWATLGVLLDGDDPMALALIPAEAWTIEPTWFVAGMKGTGSDTIVVQDHFVPDHRVQRLSNMLSSNFLSPYKEDRMANVAFNAVAAAILIAPQIGLARHALEITLAKLPSKPVAYTIYNNAKDSPTHQLAVAKAASNLHLSELLLNRMCLDIDTAADAGEQLDLATRARIRNDTGVIAELVGQAIDALMTANGAGSFAEANVLNQIWRDSEIAARHAFVTPEIGKEAYGRVLMGLEPTINL
ncbi:Acyl-CoA dehydrogenase [Arthrobacter sp. 9V]|uniref:acyl-CoA dehydrogenase family protein n=1 Tax=Arthrobacter sp. 9V TaxID=2653132 RepID=UPI0012F2CA73|nr:acyl-CoA dehydrogenase family protein [Arthrobacter sp. 9V]VXB43228.1 Acyl-CoA dehydrogenase [Arthrobacter sp. 9V]